MMLFFSFPFLYKHIFSDAPSVSVHLANEEPIPSRLIMRSEHENVTLKCRANANPPVEANSFGWYKNVTIFFLPFTHFDCRFVYVHHSISIAY